MLLTKIRLQIDLKTEKLDFLLRRQAKMVVLPSSVVVSNSGQEVHDSATSSEL